MKHVLQLWILTIIFISCFINLIPAEDTSSSEPKQLKISTTNNRPISIDRLLHTAFEEISYNVSITSDLFNQGYALANEGERDGVISFISDMEKIYHNLIKVPVVLEESDIVSFMPIEKKIEINGWSDLGNLRVGILTQKTYIQNQIPDTSEVVIKESIGQLLEGLVANEYDVAILIQYAYQEFNLPNNIVFAGKIDSLPEYLYLHESHEKLISHITRSLNNVFADGRGEKILMNIPIPGMFPKRTILHIISTNTEVTREEEFNEVLRDQFNDDMSLDWYSIALNSKRFSDEPNRLTYFANLLRQDCVSRDVAAIIVSGSEALEFLKEYYFLFFRNVPVLFYGVEDNSSALIYNYERYFTGVVEHISALETVSLALNLFPDTKSIYVVNDYTSEGKSYRASIQNQLKPFENKISIEYNQNIDRDSLLAYINGLPSDSLLFVGSYFRDVNGQYFSQNEMKRSLEQYCNVPIVALYSTAVEYNSIGGKCLDYKKYGEIISNMLKRLLLGENVAAIPPIINSEIYNRWVFDKNIMDRLGIAERSLPENSEILNKRLSIWETNPAFVFSMIATLIMSLAISIGLYIFLNRLKKQNLALIEMKKNLHTAEELLVKDVKIREVKERLERIINTAPVAYMMTVNGIVVESNEYMKKHVGVRDGDDAQKFYTDISQRNALIDLVLKHGLVSNKILKFNMANGEIHRFLSNVTNFEHQQQLAYILWGMDIEESERQKDQLNATQESLQMVLDTLPIPVRIVDLEDSTIIYGNNSFLDMFEYNCLEDVCGIHISEILPKFQSNGTESILKIGVIIDSEGPTNMEVEYLTASGKIIDALLTSCHIEYKNRKASVGIIKDLTLEKQTKKLLLNAAEKEKEANHLKGRFLVSMSHEIRTPMNAIIGLTEIELRKKPSEETKNVYKKINSSAKNLLQIINDILDLSKIEANKMELYADEFELEEVINSALLVATPRLDGKNVEFMFRGSFDLPRFIVGDRTRLWQILKNFLDNSGKYTENGKIILTTSVDDEQSNAENIYIKFIIEDTGIGMNEEQLRKIFMPYNQFYSEAQKKYSGTGLGMTISKQLCELMGGKLQITSKEGVGTTIEFSLPFKHSLNNETQMQVIKSPLLSGTNILSVDDDDISLSVMSGILKCNDVNCVTARSGEEALKTIFKYRDKGIPFDIILLDYMMDGLNGLETAKQIQLSLSKAPKLLMVTSYQRQLLKNELDEHGIDDIIEKPFIPSQFIQKICAALGYKDDADETIYEVSNKFKDVKVLVCEDNHINQEVAIGMLGQFGIESTMADNGKEGIEILDKNQSFDLIFMDLQMPVMDGYEATRIIRTNEKFKDIPIISLTADAMTEVVNKCLKTGMNDHLAKPIDFNALYNILLKWLPENKRVSQEKPTDIQQAVTSFNLPSEGIARFGGKKDLYKKVLLEFAHSLPEKWPKFSQMVQNIDEMKRDIHKIKGVAGNLSIKNIYECAVEFEKSLHILDPDKELYERLIYTCNAEKNQIIGQLEIDTNTPIKTGTNQEFVSLISKLKEALQDYDPSATSKLIETLKEKKWPLVDQSKFQQMCELALNYEFNDALNVLNSMEEKNE